VCEPPLWTSTKVSTPQVRVPSEVPCQQGEPRAPEQSRAAQPRRPTCRAPDLDGSDGSRRTPWKWPPAQGGLPAPLPRLGATAAEISRLSRAALSVHGCVYTSWAILEAMGRRVLRVVPRTHEWLERELAVATGESPTYSEIGRSLEPEPFPEGYRSDQYEATLGTGAVVFERATQGLRAWRAHRLRGLSVYPAQAPVEEGATVLVCMGIGLVLPSPCRIVKVLNEPDRRGFAYGTLPGHPEQGEEVFLVSQDSSGAVHFEIRAFSRPANRLVELSGPFGRAVQRSATEGYLASLRRYVGA
jgi:uncharacterized protein (UPF0548 family)